MIGSFRKLPYRFLKSSRSVVSSVATKITIAAILGWIIFVEDPCHKYRTSANLDDLGVR